MNNYRDIFTKILEAIDYNDDKNKFIDEFYKNIKLQSLIDLIKTLPSDKQIEFQKQLSENNNQEKVTELLKNYFFEDQIQESIKNATSNAIFKYLQSISYTLSNFQKEKLTKVLESL